MFIFSLLTAAAARCIARRFDVAAPTANFARAGARPRARARASGQMANKKILRAPAAFDANKAPFSWHKSRARAAHIRCCSDTSECSSIMSQFRRRLFDTIGMAPRCGGVLYVRSDERRHAARLGGSGGGGSGDGDSGDDIAQSAADKSDASLEKTRARTRRKIAVQRDFRFSRRLLSAHGARAHANLH